MCHDNNRSEKSINIKTSPFNQPTINFINIKRKFFFVRMSFFYVHATREKLLKRRFVQKFFAFNADEIDTYHQFHQRFTQAFFVQNFGAKNHKAECN